MPVGWSKPREIASLADSRAVFEFEIPVSELPGISIELLLPDAPVRVALRFDREQGRPVADVSLRASLQLRCQRCMGPMGFGLTADSRVAVVESEAAADALPGELETFLAPEGQCDLLALAAEELLLALPVVPRHADGERCEIAPGGAVIETAEAEPVASDTQRPFADLRALLERDRH
jgi:uncharacterized protein